MPVLNLSELNIVTSVLGAFTVIYGVMSVKIKQAWFLGEARKFSLSSLFRDLLKGGQTLTGYVTSACYGGRHHPRTDSSQFLERGEMGHRRI